MDDHTYASSKLIGPALTFDDVLLVPRHADFHPRECDISTPLTRSITLNIPLISAPMDTVTESSLAIALAQEGGIGIIHRNLTVEQQCREVHKVKRSESGVITDPATLRPTHRVEDAARLMELQNVSGVPITQEDGTLAGIITRRDLKFLENMDRTIADVMTQDNLVTAPPDTTLDEALVMLKRAKVEKLLLVDERGKLRGLITMRDVTRSRDFPNRCVDKRGRLRVGAAIGAGDLSRAAALVEAGVDVISIDSAHGHSANVIRTVQELQQFRKIEVIAGNVGTADGAKALIEAGADAVKVGIGPGSICTTRVVTGVGLPQISAVLEVAAVADVPVIADGGVRYSGDIAKALAAGAHSVMLGSLFAGLDESPGQLVIWKGRRFKEYRGMGSLGAMSAGSADRYDQDPNENPRKMVPEGVEGRVPYRGSLAEFVFQLVGGLRQGMGYCGCRTLAALRRDARFVQVTHAGVLESHPHDIMITKEPTNYAIQQPTTEE
jgi:IMP dehydrogenase